MVPQRTWLYLACLAFLVASSPCASAQSEPSLVKVRSQYDRDRQQAKQKLQSDFDTVLDRLSKSREPADRKLILLDVVKQERSRFDKSGLIPWSAPMLPYTDAYLKQLQTGQNKVISAYNAEIDKHLRRRDDGKVTALRADLMGALGIDVVARWRHQAGQNNPLNLAFYSNGRVDSPESKTTWSLEGGRLLIRGPNPNAPGGAWVDSCAVAQDGQSYSGTNQARTQIGGKYLTQ